MQPVHVFGVEFEEPSRVPGRGREPVDEDVLAPVIRAQQDEVALVAIFDGAALVMSPDTGPLHISVALDRPVVSLIGYSNPKRVGPYRKYHDLMIDAYGDPGEDYPISMENRPGRMPRIGVDDVLDRVQRWRDRYRA